MANTDTSIGDLNMGESSNDNTTPTLNNEPIPDAPSAITAPGTDNTQVVNTVQVTDIIGNGTVTQRLEPSKLSLHTIPKGTTLYHGSLNLTTFNSTRINVGDDKCLVAFFSPNKEIASMYINQCRGESNGTGYIHEFITVADIGKIYIFSPDDKDLVWKCKEINENFCEGGKYGRLNGVGFSVPNKEKGKFVDGKLNLTENQESSEFALCNPGSDILKYVQSFRCNAHGVLSDEYKFTPAEN